MVNQDILFMFKVEKMSRNPHYLSRNPHYLTRKQIRKELYGNTQSEEESSQRDAFKKLSEIIAKYKRREPLSSNDFYIIARKMFPILGRSNEITLSIGFLNACAELLFASKEEFKEKQDALMLLLFDEIRNIPFHPMNSEITANGILRELERTGEVNIKNREKICSAIHFLMKLYTKHNSTPMNSSHRVCIQDFNLKLYPFLYSDETIEISLFGNGHNEYIRDMRSSSIIPRKFEECMICTFVGTTDEMEYYVQFGYFIRLIAKRGTNCTCWEKFVEANQERKISSPCSVKDCYDGFLCKFCNKYKDMQLIEPIAVLNDSFKNGSFSEDVYNDLFNAFCQIIIDGSSVPIMPLVMKLRFYELGMTNELVNELFHLIEKFDIFFRKMNCLPRPTFLSTPNLRDFTKADYQAYMEKLKRGQHQFQTVIPELGFCYCNKIAKLNRIKAEVEKERELDKVAAQAVKDSINTTISYICGR